MGGVGRGGRDSMGSWRYGERVSRWGENLIGIGVGV